MKPIQVVLDTNVLVAGLRSADGASAQLVGRLGSSGWEINLSGPVALEYEAVLKRPGLIPGRSLQEIDEFLDYLFGLANLMVVGPRREPRLKDPDDERILEAAITVGATIVTHNVRDFLEAGQYGVQVVTPGDFLRELKKEQ